MTSSAPARSVTPVGFIGLGNMGGALAANLVAAGHQVVANDAAGVARKPDGAAWAPSVSEVAQLSATIVLSLPDGTISERVAAEISAAAECTTRHVIDTSTVGVGAARTIAALLAKVGVDYVDAPVSGGVAGARARTLAVMYAGSDSACAAVEPVLRGLSDRRYRVGTEPGMAQAVKLANNFLSATALAATSEAVAFGEAVGLDIPTMLEVLAGSSGQNAAITDKFPNHVVTGRYASGFANSLMAKDVRLYRSAVDDAGSPSTIGDITTAVWERFADEQPGVDFTRIYPFVRGAGHDRNS
jgi:3-hydroxyisobutyrate dehydrogenase-like beta-hydroxyacid dehydrogenase